MAVSSVNSYQGSSVLIQSTTNRQRIDEQSRSNRAYKDDANATKVAFEQRYPQSSTIKASANSENVYAEAERYINQKQLNHHMQLLIQQCQIRKRKNLFPQN